MWRMLPLSVVVFLVCLFSAAAAARAQESFRVIEAETKAVLRWNQLAVNLVLENSSPSFAAKIRLEIMDAEDRIIGQAVRTETIKRGKRAVQIPVIFRQNFFSGLLWHRLRYSIVPIGAAANSDQPPAAGIVSLSEIMPQIFELRASAAENVFPGMNYRVRVRAFHPLTDQPSAGVKISAEFSLDLDTDDDDDELEFKAKATTDREGYGVLNFQIPPDVKLDDDGEIKLTGEKNGITRELEIDLDALKMPQTVYLNTDKPIYQPNQNFHARGLLLSQNFNSLKAVGEKELEFIIEDQDDALLYRETVKTSRFGIAAVAWKIPENAKLGTYKVRVKNDDDDELGHQTFQISRYELPNFTVTAKTDKTFYLPGDAAAEITVNADYLFGKPVTKGKVKIVREIERFWNYSRQKWETQEEKPYEGETDKDGKFVAKVDLSHAQKELKEKNYLRFEDAHFAAYFTDSTTNRTEQRRFDVRVSKEAIHVYLVGINSYDDHNPKLPLQFYVSTFYADGLPAAACNVEIKGKYEDEAGLKTLAQIRTNDFGAGKVKFAAPRRSDGLYDKDLQIKAVASDSKDQNGSHDEEIEIDEGAKEIRAEAKKAIYKGGEPIELEIFSTEPEADVFVDVLKDQSMIESRLVKMRNGKADLNIPYREDFKGELTISAYIAGDDDDGSGAAVKDAVGVIYPSPGNLRLDVRPIQSVYRPNEEARIKFSVVSPGNSPAESALGIVVFDKAIEERARTDADFGGRGGGGRVNLFGSFDRLLQSKTFGGVSLSAINEMDLRGKIPDDLQLVAEVLLADVNHDPNFFASNYYRTDLTKVFGSHFKRQFFPVEAALKNTYAKDFEHPVDAASLRRILAENKIDLDVLRDPWGEPYRPVFTVEGDQDVLSVWSTGVNKIFEKDKSAAAAAAAAAARADDLLVLQMKFKYFTPLGKAIDRAVREHRLKTGAFVRDYAGLKKALETQNVDLDALRDRWNRPYRIDFHVSGRWLVIDFKSTGPDGKSDPDYYDDFFLWTNRTDFFRETESRLQAILSNHLTEKKAYPKSENEFREILKRNGVDFGELRDGWNRPVSLLFSTFSRYADKVKTEVTSKFDEKPQEKTILLPVTQQVAQFKILSPGADGVGGNYDDVVLSTFSGVVAEQSKDDAKPVELKTEVSFTGGGSGAIHGVVTDPYGAVVPSATVRAVNEENSLQRAVVSNDEGKYLIENLPAGKYTITVEAAGFSSSVITNVPIRSMILTELNFSLVMGSVSAVVNVTGSDETVVETTSFALTMSNSALSKLKPGAAASEKGKAQINVPADISTPRLREYFPETLVWRPELVTDKNGKAELKFKLGDNITTWKVYTIASNAAGKIGLAEREIKAFQPFFVDLEPPKILTVGDEIALSAQIRNYNEKAQKVNVVMAGADWFSFLKQANQQIEVLPNATQNAIFDFRADNAVKEGKQRVTAISEGGGGDSDAIEKPVFVHPDGQEIVQTESRLFRETVSFDVNFPASALPETRRGELKIHPNLLAHVAESVEGILRRPYGCGEQAISSTYPNLMILKVGKTAQLSPKLQAQAQKFLQQGYERLLGYQQPDGGFSIWAKDAADVALTAYALRFLGDAGDFIEVDETAVDRARRWLLAQQRADGSWTRTYSWEKTEDKQRAKIFTTYVARILAMTEKDKKEKSKDVQASLGRAFEYLKTRNAEIDEPYALASFALALFDAGETEAAQKITGKLAAMAIAEGDGAYWKLETNTPFYGWGTAGRIETTALALQALIKDDREMMDENNPKSKIQNLKSAAAIFLLKNKDKYGVWYSTQATINVLDSLLASLSGVGKTDNQTQTAEVFVNGQKIKDVALPPSNTLAAPVSLDLPLASNENRVEVKIGGNGSAAMGQVVQSHYISWRDAIETATGRNINQSRHLRLDYECDKREAKIAEEISCRVEAERIGFKGYGMLLAEIGIPPGAEVSRESLEKAREENWYLSRYDVLPDRIIVYMWAQAGGTRFDFRFRPRYGIRAQTAPSVVYDYYNPEAQATLAPLRFIVK